MAARTKKVPVKKVAPPAPAAQAHTLVGLRDEIDRIFERFNRQGWPNISPYFPSLPSWDPLKDIMAPFDVSRLGTSPKVEAVESKSDYEITAELPSMDDKDIEVEVSNGTLVLKGEKKDERDVDEKDYHLSERSYGSFRRVFRVPESVDASKISAGFKKGVLTVNMPKTTQAKAKQRKVAVNTV